MNSSILLCFVLVVASAADLPASAILEKFAEVGKTCAAAHNIEPEELIRIQSYDYIKTLDASNDLKCFAKCVYDKLGVFTDNGYNTENYVEITVAHNIEANHTRQAIENCKDLFKGRKDCPESWDINVCIHKYH